MALSHVVRPLDPPMPVRTRGASPFRATWTDTLTLIERELIMLGAPRHKPWVLQLDVPESRIRKDGGVYSNTTAPPPCRVAFESRHGPLIYTCDKFWKWQDNVRAIALSLEALRKVDRYGVAGAGEQYRGWTTLSRPARHDGRSRPTRPDPDAQPYIPWRAHAHNPRPAPLVPDPGANRSRPPVAWGTQCRECWGWLDDPRHLAT